jgi:hypothetical protein
MTRDVTSVRSKLPWSSSTQFCDTLGSSERRGENSTRPP